MALICTLTAFGSALVLLHRVVVVTVVIVMFLFAFALFF